MHVLTDFTRYTQIRQPEYTLDPLNLDPLLPLGVADYTFVLSAPASSSSADASPAPESSNNAPPPPHPRRVSLGKGKFSEVLLVRKGSVEVSFVRLLVGEMREEKGADLLPWLLLHSTL